MKKIGFIGAYDKTDLLLYVAKILTVFGRRVLIIDATITQKSKYIVPTIEPVETYITQFEGIDVAVGFKTLEEIKNRLGVEEDNRLGYDIMLVDTDQERTVRSFNLQSFEKLYYVTSFDTYSLKKGIEVLREITTPVNMTKIFYNRYASREQEEYFEYLAMELKVMWNEEKLYFILENGDSEIILENQRVANIRLKKLSNEYKKNLAFIVNDIDVGIDEKKIRNIIKNL